MNHADAPVLIMAGGTGGHIFPGLAVAAELARRGVPVTWLGSEGRLETELVPRAGIPLDTLRIGAIRGKGFFRLLRVPIELAAAVLAARRVLRRCRPRSVLSMGGFAAGPGGLAAWLARVPLVVHEQNRVPGVTNRALAKFATRVLVGFADAFAKNSSWVGNPVRETIDTLPSPEPRFAARVGIPRLLVLGGSQGAQVLNARVPEAIARLSQQLEIRHQCGARHAESTRTAYAAAGIAASVEPFIDDMAVAYAWADLVLCRSGALTVAELSAAGVGAVLVPFAAAVDDHQTKNAEALVVVGAAVLVPEREASVERLAAVLDELLTDRPRLARMATSARTLAKPHAATRIADVCLEVAV